jgi:hypothetical protein
MFDVREWRDFLATSPGRVADIAATGRHCHPEVLLDRRLPEAGDNLANREMRSRALPVHRSCGTPSDEGANPSHGDLLCSFHARDRDTAAAKGVHAIKAQRL